MDQKSKILFFTTTTIAPSKVSSVKFGVNKDNKPAPIAPPTPEKPDVFVSRVLVPPENKSSLALETLKRNLQEQLGSFPKKIKLVEARLKPDSADYSETVEELRKVMEQKGKLEAQIEKINQTSNKDKKFQHFKAEADAFQQAPDLLSFNAKPLSRNIYGPSRATELLKAAFMFDHPETIKHLYQAGYFHAERNAEKEAYLTARQQFPLVTPPNLQFDTEKIGPITLLHAIEADAEKCFDQMLALGAAVEEPLYTSIKAGGNSRHFKNLESLLKAKINSCASSKSHNNYDILTSTFDSFDEESFLNVHHLYSKYLSRLLKASR